LRNAATSADVPSDNVSSISEISVRNSPLMSCAASLLCRPMRLARRAVEVHESPMAFRVLGSAFIGSLRRWINRGRPRKRKMNDAARWMPVVARRARFILDGAPRHAASGTSRTGQAAEEIARRTGLGQIYKARNKTPSHNEVRRRPKMRHVLHHRDAGAGGDPGS
jgi:hypothetical protein